MVEVVRKPWSFSVKIVAPVVGSTIIGIAACVGFSMWTADRIDDDAAEMQRALVAQLISSARGEYEDMQAGFATWDDAVVAIRDNDTEWIDQNLVADAYATYGLDRVYVLNPDRGALYASRLGGKVDPSTYNEDAATFAPLLDRLTDTDGIARISAYNAGIASAPILTDYGVVGGNVAIIAVVPLLSESDELIVEAKDAHFIATAHFLTTESLRLQRSLMGVSDGKFVGGPAGEAALAHFPVLNAQGSTVGSFVWPADRPAGRMTMEALPALGGTALIIGFSMFSLLRRLRKVTQDLDAAREQAVHLALHDPLTGLANRAMFQKRLTEALESLHHSGSPIALLALDLDRFKEVNDRLGHEAGDELLRQVAARLRSLLDDHDAVARLGGDEFVVLQHALKTVSEARHLSERIIETIGAPYWLAEQEVSVGVSIGVAIANDAARDGLDLPARADFALYQAKESGRNTYRLYETDAEMTVARDKGKADAA